MSRWPVYWQAPERAIGPYFQRTTANGQTYRPGLYYVPTAWYGVNPCLYQNPQNVLNPRFIPYKASANQMNRAFTGFHPQYIPTQEIQQSHRASYQGAKTKADSDHVEQLLPSDVLVYPEDYFNKVKKTGQREHKSVHDAPPRSPRATYSMDSLPEEMTSISYEDESVISLVRSMDYFYSMSSYDAAPGEAEPLKDTSLNQSAPKANRDARLRAGSDCKRPPQPRSEMKKKSPSAATNRRYLPIGRYPRFVTVKQWKEMAERRRKNRKNNSYNIVPARAK